MKKLLRSCLTFMVLSASLLTASCELGLGVQVDTDTPVVSINTPAISSVMGGSVTVTGACSDDAGVARVEVSLRDKSGEITSLGDATVSLDKRSWSVDIDLTPYADGSYSIIVNALDGADRHALATREFSIDNTPPVVLLSKPNSFNPSDIGSGGYGKTVTLAGEVLDDNEIISLTVSVFRYDKESGTETEVKLPHPKFTGFDVQGGLNLVIAQENSDDEALKANYKAIYDLEGESTQYFTMVVTVADAAGNTNTFTYIKTALNKVVHEATGVEVKRLVSTDYKKILNGTYSGSLDEETVGQILRGTYPDADPLSYMSSSEGSHVMFTVCPDSSPKYELSGYDISEGFKEASQAGTLSIGFEKGLDAKFIDPSTVEVRFYAYDLENNRDITGVPFWTTEDAVEGSDAYKSIYKKNGGTITYLKAMTELMDNSTFLFTLPKEISGGNAMRVEVLGKDEDGNDLAPKMKEGYGFVIAQHGGAPQVSCNDSTWYDGKYYQTEKFAQNDEVKLVLSVVDTSKEHEFGVRDAAIAITPIIYTGYQTDFEMAEVNADARNAKRKCLNTTYVDGDDTSYIEKLSDENYKVTIPVNGLNLAELVGQAENYTVILKVTASNGTSDTKYWCLYADGTAPVVEMTNPWVPDANGKVTRNFINESNENSSYWNRKKQGDITVNSYTLRGFWSDREGSGTKAVYFRTAAKGETLVSEEILSDPTKWNKVDDDDAPVNATDRIGINNSQVVREGSGWQIAVYAVDNVGNRSDILSYSNLVFDFGDPYIEVPLISPYYARSSEPVSITVTAKDTNLMKSVQVVAKHNGTTVASGADGYTVSYGSVVPRTLDMKSVDAYDCSKVSTQTATISIRRDGNVKSDGKWEFSVVATDDVDRTSEAAVFSTVVDATPPSSVGSAKVEGAAYNPNVWFSKDTVTIGGFYKEETSGLDSVYYLVSMGQPDASITDITQMPGCEVIAESGASGSSLGISITPSTLKNGSNIIYVQTKDTAGNLSAVTPYVVNVDLDIPDLTAEYYTYDNTAFLTAKSTVLSNGKKDLILYGLVKDGESGINDFTGGLTVGTDTLNATFSYTTDEVPNTVTEDWFKTANFKPFTNFASSPANITAWKAVVKKDSIEAGSAKLLISDHAGNSSKQTLFAFSMDETSPKLELVTPQGGTKLNGNVNFTGNVKETSLDFVSLYYSYTFSAKTIVEGKDVLVGTKTGASAYSWTFDNVRLSYEEDGKTKIIGGDEYTSAKTIYFKVRALDSAGNETIETYSYIVDPDADRPQLTLRNLKKENTMLKGTTVYGTVSDDDGSVQGLWYTTDPAIATVPTIEDDNGWNRITLENGAFNVDAEGGDGMRTWYFYCIDGVGGTYSTLGESSLKRPYMVFLSQDGTGTTDRMDCTTGVTFFIDTTPPDLAGFKLSRAAKGTTTKASLYQPSEDGDDRWRDEARIVFGGKSSVMYIKLEVDETSAMSATEPVTVSIGENAIALNSSNFASFANGIHYTYIVGPIDVSRYESATCELAVSVMDNAGTSVPQSKNVVIDNKAPEVNVISPKKESFVTSTVKISGTVRDNAGGSGVASVKWFIPTNAERTSGVSADTKRNGSSVWIENSGTTLNIEFNSHIPGANDNILRYANDPEYRFVLDEAMGRYGVPVYFLVEDSLGNSSIDTTNYISVDTLASQPYATIQFPQDGKPVGGTINVTGTAYDDLAVKSVRLQLDVNGDNKYTEADYAILADEDNGWISANGWENTDLVASTSNDANDWYIRMEGTNTWKSTIKVPDSYVKDSSGNATTKSLGLRACAYDDVPQSRGWLSSVRVEVSKNVPEIGSFKLLQKDGSGNSIIERDYTPGMYISGHPVGCEWYLVGNASDDGSITKVEFATKNEGEDDCITLNWTDGNLSVQEYPIVVQINTDSDGHIYSKLTVTDNNNTEAEQFISIYVDSKKPSLYTKSGIETSSSDDVRITSGEKIIGDGTDGTSTVRNDDRLYKFGDEVFESGSGLSYVAFYFLRKSSGNGDRIYYPVINPGETDANRIAVNGTSGVEQNSDGLMVLSLTGLTRESTSTLQHASLKNNVAIRSGGLVKIGGMYRKITAYDSSSGTVTFDPAVGTNFTTAEFAYAQVVDHHTEETPVYDSNGNYDGIDNDDGDGLIEYFDDTAGTLYRWNAQIQADFIPDGPIEIHVVAIDNAGNVSSGSVKSSVQNNRPRIAKILLGTDLNGNGKFDYDSDEDLLHAAKKTDTESGRDFGEFRYYSTIDADGKEQDDITIAVQGIEDAFIVKDQMLLLPEFVGGNGTLGSVYDVKDDLAGATIKTGTVTSLLSYEEVMAKVSSVGSKAISDHVSQKGGFYLANTSLEGKDSRSSVNGTKLKYFAITFWDQTDETVQGYDSQHALIRLPVIVDVADDAKPEPVLTPLYWNSKERSSIKIEVNGLEDTSNSVYKDARGNLLGHIELSEDWKKGAGYTGDNSGLSDADAKVSGIIRIQGRAKDERRLGSIQMTIGGTYSGSTYGVSMNSKGENIQTSLASFTNGEWVYAKDATLETDGWQFRILSETLNQKGHEVDWELDLDTSFVSKNGTRAYTALDQTVKVTVYDSTNLNQSDSWRVDIVPYVTGITTGLSDKSENSSVYARTALGHYPVYATREGFTNGTAQNEKFESITVSGYNLTGASAKLGNVTLAPGAENEFALNASCASGKLTLTVNGITTLNNINNNDSQGAYGYNLQNMPKEGSDTVYANFYNRQPNGENNNILTDDLELDVWDFNSKAAIGYKEGASKVANAVMEINPTTGMLGFAFSNGSVRFSMPGKENSYQHWNMSYDYMGYTGLVYDSFGFNFACAVGADINSGNGRDHFTLMSSRWGQALDGGIIQFRSNKWSGNIIGLDTIGQTNSDTDTSGNSPVAKNRFQSQSFALRSYTNAEGKNADDLYLAYYDLLNEEIRFKAGSFTNETKRETPGTYLGDARNSPTKYSDTSQHCQIIASSRKAENTGNAEDTAKTLGQATNSVSIGVTSSNTVVLVWYDGTDLLCTYNTNPLESATDSTKRGLVRESEGKTSWQGPFTLMEEAGEGCKIVIDSGGNIHVAAYDGMNSDLKYVYVPASGDGFDFAGKTECTVDSYLDVGQNLTLDVAKVGNYQIPYIGYWGTFPELPRYAYLAAPETFYNPAVAEADKQGAIDDLYTGVWECSIVPSTSSVEEGTMNVAVWKDGDGNLAWSTYNDATTFSGAEKSAENVLYTSSVATIDSGICYGNGTNNGVLGYVVSINGATSHIETAQKR